MPTIIENDTTLIVANGSSVNDITVNSFGVLRVSAGGTANKTTVNTNGYMHVSSGGTANYTTVNRNGLMYVSANGKANYTTVNDNGIMYVSSQGTANSTTVNWLGALFVSPSGTANSTTVKGDLYVYNGGTVNYTTVSSGGHLDVESGGTANNTTVSSGGRLDVYSGGKANYTTVNDNGIMYVSSQGTANNTTVSSGGQLDVDSGGTANSTTVNWLGALFVSPSGTANYTTVKGDLYVYNGGTVNYTTVYSSGDLCVYNGATANSTTVTSGGKMQVNDDGKASNTTVYSGGHLDVNNGATANSTTVYSGGKMQVNDGGTANKTTVSSGGNLTVDGGTANNTTVSSDGAMFVNDDATANNTTVASGGYLCVDGGTANSTTVNDGELFVSDGGTANDTTVSQGGYMHIFYSGTANDTTVSGGGNLTVDGGTANDTTVNSGGSLTVYNGGTANGATVNSRGRLTVNSGGMANGATVNSGGNLFVNSGGMASDATVSSGGRLDVYGSGTATGWLTMHSGAIVSAYADSIIDFDISPLEPGYKALVNNLSLIQGTPTYTATVSTTQSIGDYVLAEGAANFTGSVTVKCGGAEDLTLAVGETKLGDAFAYSLTVKDSQLLLTLAPPDTTPPEPPVAQASTTEPTNQDVTVTAAFSDDSEVKQYSLDGSTWSEYTEGIVLTENGMVYFRAADAAGNVCDPVSYTVSNIDKVAPEAPTAQASTTEPTNQDVTVTAAFSDDSEAKEYSLDGSTWSEYTEPVALAENGTVSFRGTDTAGNASEVTTVVVDNIDKIAPEAPTAQASTTEPTNQDVTVTAAFSDDSEVKQYSLDGAEWSDYTDPVVLAENGAVSFRGTDAAGNVSDIATVVVDNIDKVQPEAPTATADATWTVDPVAVTAAFSDDSVVREYSLDGEDWLDYTEPVVVRDNGTVYFRGTDAAGNTSEITSYAVGSIVEPIVLEGRGTATLKANLPVAGAYALGGDFGNITGVVAVYNDLKMVGIGTLKKGVLYFRNGQPVLLDNSLKTKVKVKVKGGRNLDFTLTLTPEKVYARGDHSDDWGDRNAMGADGAVGDAGLLGEDSKGAPAVEDWVGFGDKVDYKAFTLDSAASVVFDLEATDATRIEILSLSGRQGKYAARTLSGTTARLDQASGKYVCSTRPVALEAGTYYLAVKSTNAARGADAEYTVSVGADSVFYTEGDNTDDAWRGAPAIAGGAKQDDWVGIGDAVDYRAIEVDEKGGFYSFSLSGVENDVKLTVYSVAANGSLKRVKSVTATATKDTASTGPLMLAGGGNYVLEVTATGAKKGRNSHYSVNMDELGVFTGLANNTWNAATALDGEFQGCLGKGGGADPLDYLDLSAWQGGLSLEMEAGSVKASFYDENHHAVKLASVACANDTVRTNVSLLTLKDGDNVADSIRIAALDEAVRYLKLEAIGTGMNAYRIATLA